MCRTDPLRPPAIGTGDNAMRGDAAQHRDDRGILRSREMKRYARIRQRVAVMQPPRASQLEYLIARLRSLLRAGGLRAIVGAARLRAMSRAAGRLAPLGWELFRD